MKYNITAMCKILKVPRSTFYYKDNPEIVDIKLESAIIEEFRGSQNNYGTRKLKIVLNKRGFVVSRRRIGRIMRKFDLVSNYTLRQTPKQKNGSVNNDEMPNVAHREFSDRPKYDVVVSDLTYVKIAGKWHYLCLLLDLCGRKIIGSAVGNQRNAKLIETAFYSFQGDLRRINLFHSDRASEFKNKLIEDILDAFGIKRSLSRKGAPIDNAVAESMYNIVKTEFTFGMHFADLDEFKLLWFDYVNWYNNIRIHGSLGYKTPNQWHNSA